MFSRIFIGIILLITTGICGCRANTPENVEEDGGVNNYDSGKDAPKTVISTEIESFECELSFVSAFTEEQSELEGRVYTLIAFFENGNVKCKIEWYDRYGESGKNEFVSDNSFMISLQNIVSDYELAKFNGYSKRVNGLPDMYGALLNIEYASGESIYAYDNEENFVPSDAANKLIKLFCP